MNKKTQIIIGVLAVSATAIYLWKMNSKKNFTNAKNTMGRRATNLPEGDCIPNTCCRYEGNCLSSVGGGLESAGTIIQGWSNSSGGRGIIVANGENRCLVCPYSPGTSTGMPIQIN
jgi:hypothetical protein